jgi:hypothetical protein
VGVISPACRQAAREARQAPVIARLQSGRKRCPRCAVLKPLADFSPQASAADGHAAWCKPCRSTYETQRRRRIRELARRIEQARAAEITRVAQAQGRRAAADLARSMAERYTEPKPLPGQPDWSAAVCATHPQRDLWWTSDLAAHQHRAAMVCRTCPVATACLSYALSLPAATDRSGVYAATTPADREHIRLRAATAA